MTACTRDLPPLRRARRCTLHHRQASHQASAPAANVFGGEEHRKGHAALREEVIKAIPVEEMCALAKVPAACASARSDCRWTAIFPKIMSPMLIVTILEPHCNWGGLSTHNE